MTVRVRRRVESLPPYRGLDTRRVAVRLDGNECPDGPGATVLEAVTAMDAETLGRYPDTGALRTRWARYLGVRQDQLMLTAGSGPAIAMAAELVLEAGTTAVLLAPSFELYGLAITRRGARAVAVSASPWGRFPMRGVRTALEASAVSLCVLGFPDNPTGVAPSQRQVERLLDRFPRTLFVIDEAYAEFTGRSVLPLVRRHRNLLVLRTFSKAFGLAGMRVGGVVGPRRLVARLARVNVPYPVTAPATVAARAALRDDRPMRAAVTRVRRERPRLVRALTRLGLRARATAANFVLVDTGSSGRARVTVAALAACGVAVRDRSHLPGMSGMIRISVGTAAEHARLIDAWRVLTAPAPDALLLDMDGTLVDVSRSYDEIIWRLVRDRVGRRAGSRQAVLAIKNDPGANDDIDAILLALRQRGVTAERAAVAREFIARYRGPDGWYRRDRWMISLVDLRTLSRWQRLALVTGRPRAEVALAFRLLPARRCFDVVVTADDTRRHKPDPAPLRRARRALGARRPWMVGDSPADLAAAQAAGIPAIAIDSGDRADVLRRYAPLAVLDSPRQLLDIMRGRALLAAFPEAS